ncbi:hypothetical protein [Aureispira sp. CCB-E]|uniref:hypothetical protein n=1 Tax=Aureispira sp. CCB-E TaxID=3051121 RepID=UPI0028693106|nr:hypothetical protein [Aureispira sp. CCB-E]WMX15866.1 hypothetical protein QP953_05635 [Aureispira sp. CCB-E]
MIKTNPTTIRKGILNHLQKLQKDIDALPDYKTKVKQAKVLWQNKKKTNAQKAAFNRVEKELQKIAIGTNNYCNYCEANIGTTIEHIYPRGLYPNKTFVWENYLWTCKQCNGKHKVSQFKIFKTPDSAKVINLVKDYQFIPPPNEDAVFINPRTENPLDYLQLDLHSGLFYPKATNKQTRAYKRAAYTIETLQLNTRDGLVKNRLQAYQNYQTLLQQYIDIQSCSSLEQLYQLFTPSKYFQTFSLEAQKSYASLNLQQQLINQAHPTVWREMQRQATTITVLDNLFQQVPETLEWL